LIIDPANGRALNASFVDYNRRLAMDMPPIRPIILETAPDPLGPFGAKGIGENPIIAIGPAIANALHDALSIRFRLRPITPEKALQALREQRQPADDTIIIDRMTCNVLDAPSEDGLCSKLLIDAAPPRRLGCRRLPFWSAARRPRRSWVC
jgi:hypothetical protein